LVLGAWGCGAFGNDPATTARSFRNALEGEFAGALSDILFAIVDWSTKRQPSPDAAILRLSTKPKRSRCFQTGTISRHLIGGSLAFSFLEGT
jgi:hypothetical protein